MPPPIFFTAIGERYFSSSFLHFHYTPAAILHRPPLMKGNPFHPVLYVSFRMLHEQLAKNNINVIVLAFSKKTQSAESCVRKNMAKRCRQALFDALHAAGYDRTGRLKASAKKYMSPKGEWEDKPSTRKSILKPAALGGTFSIKPYPDMLGASMDDLRKDMSKGLRNVLLDGVTMDEKRWYEARDAIVSQERYFMKQRKKLLHRRLTDTISQEEIEAILARD